MNIGIASVMSAILPTAEQTLLLRASLLDGKRGTSAWGEWVAIVGDAKQAFVEDRGSVKRLLPQLYVALRNNNGDVKPELMQYLKLAYVREQMRSRTYFRICRDILVALEAAQVPVLLLRGGALAKHTYPDPALRHCHDIALLIGGRGDETEQYVSRIRTALADSGRTEVKCDPAEGGPIALFRDETTLPIEIYDRPFKLSYYKLPSTELFSRSQATRIGDAAVSLLCAEDALVHVCVHASYSTSRDSLRWVGDAWYLLQGSEIDWDKVAETSQRARGLLPMYVMLKYLRDALEAPVPDSLLLRLKVGLGNLPSIARDVALHGARVGDCASLGGLFSRIPGSIRLKAITALWLLFPSTAYVREVVGIQSRIGVAGHYLRRPIAYTLRS